MQETVRKYMSQISEKWNEIEKSLRVKIILLAVGLLIALGLTVFLAVKPKWVVIEANSDAVTIGNIQKVFDDANIKNRLIKNSTAIEIQENQANQARILLAEKNVTNTGFTFENAFDTSNIGMTDRDKVEMYLRAQETAIVEQLRNIDGVDSASVKLVVPSDTALFEKEQTEASAGITVYKSKEINEKQGETMARLVCMSVKGLEMENIEIVDQEGNSIYSGSTRNINTSSTKADKEKQVTRDKEMQIRAALSDLYDDVNVMSNIVFDWNKKQQKSTTYVPPVNDMTIGVPTKSIKESENVVNGAQGQEPGVASNDQNPTNYQTENDSNASYDSAKDTNEYIYNSTEEIIEVAEGALQKDQSSISVFVYNLKEYKEAELKKKNIINETTTWEDFKSQNSAKPKIVVDPDIVQSLKVGTGIDNLTIYGYEKPVFVDEVIKPVAVEQIIILSILVILLLLLAFALIKKTKPDEIEEIEPELSVEDLIVSTQLEDEKEDEDSLAGIDEHESEYMRRIVEFIDEKPEAVAQLLRNWLTDEWE